MKENTDIEFLKTSKQHYADIGMAINFIRSRCSIENFELEPRVIPNFCITEDDIAFLENCVRKTLTANDNRAGVSCDDDWHKVFFEHAVRFALNQMLKDENDSMMKYYFSKRGDVF